MCSAVLVLVGVANSDFRFRAAPIDTSIKEILEGLRKVVTVVEPSIKVRDACRAVCAPSCPCALLCPW